MYCIYIITRLKQICHTFDFWACTLVHITNHWPCPFRCYFRVCMDTNCHSLVIWRRRGCKAGWWDGWMFPLLDQHSPHCLSIFYLTQIIRNRLLPRSSFVWNHSPGALAFYPEFSSHPLDYPFYNPTRVSHVSGRNYTAVITCNKPAQRGSSPLIKLVKSIAAAPKLSKVMTLWMIL